MKLIHLLMCDACMGFEVPVLAAIQPSSSSTVAGVELQLFDSLYDAGRFLLYPGTMEDFELFVACAACL